MENDKQINQTNNNVSHNLEEIKKTFLTDDLLAQSQKSEVYSLADEYAKTKKNKNFLVWGLIFLYVTTIGGGVYMIATMEANKNKQIEVNIAEFRQFNLVELLTEQKANQEKLVKLQKELEDLRITSKQEINKLSSKSQQKMLAAAKERARQMEENYYQQIKEKEAAILAMQKSITGEKQRTKMKAMETEQTINNYKSTSQLQGVEFEQYKAEYEAKLGRLKTEYETKLTKLQTGHTEEIESLKKENQNLRDSLILRYNPIFNEGEIAALINSKLGNNPNPILNKYNQILADEDVWKESDLNQLRNKIHNQKIIIDNLLGVGYTNSVPSALNRLDRVSRSIIIDYENLWSSLIQRIKEKNDYLGSYDYAFNYLSTINRESGYIIDARDPNRMIICIDHLYSVKKGDTAYIVKNDDVAIAKIELRPEGGRIYAKVIATLKTAKIEPFDKILIKAGGNQ